MAEAFAASQRLWEAPRGTQFLLAFSGTRSKLGRHSCEPEQFSCHYVTTFVALLDESSESTGAVLVQHDVDLQVSADQLQTALVLHPMVLMTYLLCQHTQLLLLPTPSLHSNCYWKHTAQHML